MTAPEEQFSNNQERINALRDQVADEAEDRFDLEQQEAEEGYEREVLGILPPAGFFEHGDDTEELAVDYREAARSAEVAEDLHRYDDGGGERDDLSTGFGY